MTHRCTHPLHDDANTCRDHAVACHPACGCCLTSPLVPVIDSYPWVAVLEAHASEDPSFVRLLEERDVVAVEVASHGWCCVAFYARQRDVLVQLVEECWCPVDDEDRAYYHEQIKYRGEEE